MKRRILQASGGALILAALMYVGDYLWLKIRIWRHGNALGSVVIQPYYAIAEKNNKVQFLSADAQTVACVHSLFPHLGDNPCWYVSRHTDERIDE